MALKLFLVSLSDIALEVLSILSAFGETALKNIFIYADGNLVDSVDKAWMFGDLCEFSLKKC